MSHGERFSGLAKLEDQPDGVHAKLLEPLCYTTRNGWRICVPAGFLTDYASIPRALSVLIPPRGKYNRPAIVHDWLYQKAPVDPVTGKRCTWSRADSVLREACEDVDDRFTQRWTIYLGLRAGGWVTWRRYRAKD
jgi:uncharacterized protein DUF1353